MTKGFIKKIIIGCVGLLAFCSCLYIAYTNRPIYKLDKECNLNNSKSCTELGTIYKKQNLQKSVELFNKACELNDGDGCFNLAYANEHGQGVQQNIPLSNNLRLSPCRLIRF